MELTFSRPKKLTHLGTIRYEIDMLRYAYKRLAGQKLMERDAWVYEEAFLLHYRNLIEFLGKKVAPKPKNNQKKDWVDSLYVATVWQLDGLASPRNVGEIQKIGEDLYGKYESATSQGGKISQWLQHCTVKRIDSKDWDASVMMQEIEPALQAMDPHLPTDQGVYPPVAPIQCLSPLSFSTTTGTSTSVSVAGQHRREEPNNKIE
jgi:hypothetical protein